MRRAWFEGGVIAVLLLAVPCDAMQAQDTGLRVALSAGPSWLGDRSSAEAAVHLQVGAGRAWGRTATVSLVFDVYVGEEAVATPGCLPGALCEEVTLHPGSLLGATAELRQSPWSGAVALVAGVGIHHGPSVKGGPKSSAAATVGIELDSGGGAGFGLVLGFRATSLWKSIAGVRWIASPTLGMRF